MASAEDGNVAVLDDGSEVLHCDLEVACGMSSGSERNERKRRTWRSLSTW